MPITDRVTLFGYSALEVERYVENLNNEFEIKKKELEEKIEELKKEIEELKEKIEHQKDNKKIVVKKRIISAQPTESQEQKTIMQALYDAHIRATEKVTKIQKNITMTLEKRKSLILLREKKANEMKNDLQNLINYVDSVAKDY
ncbi:MAG: hypothetical protein BWY15_00524 [Firmicutes bacterium ADurb.Bin193]|nr:MAG: hypothetical protein BWY15_00524 [Firmicutes bacterium ADurb.Bin193]